jgi:hypothetical protein
MRPNRIIALAEVVGPDIEIWGCAVRAIFGQLSYLAI